MTKQNAAQWYNAIQRCRFATVSSSKNETSVCINSAAIFFQQSPTVRQIIAMRTPCKGMPYCESPIYVCARSCGRYWSRLTTLNIENFATYKVIQSSPAQSASNCFSLLGTSISSSPFLARGISPLVLEVVVFQLPQKTFAIPFLFRQYLRTHQTIKLLFIRKSTNRRAGFAVWKSIFILNSSLRSESRWVWWQRQPPFRSNVKQQVGGITWDGKLWKSLPEIFDDL